MKKLTMALLAVLMTVTLQQAVAANVARPLLQVNTAKDINGKYDWTINQDEPIVEGGSVNFAEIDYTVLIFAKQKPSVVKAKYLSKVTILGEPAKDGTNCQVKLYDRGTIILPYGSSFKPLTVYPEQNFGGDGVSDFGLENSGGYMNTLSTAKLNNKIRSFKLKRGYMVTFSTLPSGRGYSRCFIAANADLEVKTLPAVLDQKISSYRVFKWYDTGKAALANDTRADPVSKLNVTSCYSFGLGESRLPDAECVPHHIYEDWPSSAECGRVTYSPHLKTNNEPGNSSDPNPQTVKQILDNWENLMATGMRLCSPSSHDGSLGHLRECLDSIDARGWRCDIVDLHCYWNEWNLNHNVEGWYNTYKRPIWISEWVWGSSWGNEGIFKEASSRDNPTATDLQRNKTVIQGVCENWNKASYIERYYYWNSEVNCSKIYMDGKLTPAGEYYATINSGLAYSGTSYVPKTPKQQAPKKFGVSYDKKERKAIITWYDHNGEYNQSMTVERTDDGGKTWTAVGTVDQKETAASYTYSDGDNVRDGMGYRVHIVNLNGGNLYSSVAYTQIANIETGDALTVGSDVYYVGGNILTNGDFILGLNGWMSGTGENIGQPWFQAVPSGSIDGSAHLMAYGHKGADDAASLKTYVAIEPNTMYYFQIDSRNGGSNVAVNVSPDDKSLGTLAAKIPNTTEWKRQFVTFNSGADNHFAVLSFSMLGAQAQFDNIELRALFTTAEAAETDGAACQAVYDNWRADIDVYMQKTALQNTCDSLVRIADAIGALGLPSTANLSQLISAAQNAETVETMTAAVAALRAAVEAAMPTVAAATQPQSPSFATANGWTTKAGTFTGGDQRTNSAGGKTCWNAWWGNVSASEGEAKTMEVKQTVTGLEEGIYALECKATTEHYCLSDQHGYIVSGDDSGVTPALTYDYFDLPVSGTIWETLTPTPVYVAADGSVTIGFKSSKQGAIDNAWHKIGDVNNTGDKREGWWCATDFRLLYRPLLKATVATGEWSTICLPYATLLPAGARFYAIAGITDNDSKLCLQPVDALAAGQPAIYIADEAQLVFEEYGERVAEALSTDQTNYLFGHFGSRRATKGSYVLKEGRWQPLEKSEVTPANTAYISNVDAITRLDSWDGITIPIDIPATAIRAVATGNDSSSAVYTLGGRQAVKAKKGVYVKNGKKVVVK